MRIFVYGSLMKNGYNHQEYLTEAKFWGSAILRGYEMFNLGSFPGIAAQVGEQVKGEVFEIDEPILKRLDVLEGNGYLYTRQVVKVDISDGSLTCAWVYVWNGQVNPAEKIAFRDQPWTNTKYVRRVAS